MLAAQATDYFTVKVTGPKFKETRLSLSLRYCYNNSYIIHINPPLIFFTCPENVAIEGRKSFVSLTETVLPSAAFILVQLTGACLDGGVYQIRIRIPAHSIVDRRTPFSLATAPKNIYIYTST